jgi:hypothetical protein
VKDIDFANESDKFEVVKSAPREKIDATTCGSTDVIVDLFNGSNLARKRKKDSAISAVSCVRQSFQQDVVNSTIVNFKFGSETNWNHAGAEGG